MTRASMVKDSVVGQAPKVLCLPGTTRFWRTTAGQCAEELIGSNPGFPGRFIASLARSGNGVRLAHYLLPPRG